METCASCKRPIDEATGAVRYSPPKLDAGGQIQLPARPWIDKRRPAPLPPPSRAPLLHAWPDAGRYCPRCWVRAAKGLRAAYRHARAEAKIVERRERRNARFKAREQRAAEREADRKAREERKAARVAAGLRRAKAREERAARVAARKAAKETTS